MHPINWKLQRDRGVLGSSDDECQSNQQWHTSSSQRWSRWYAFALTQTRILFAQWTCTYLAHLFHWTCSLLRVPATGYSPSIAFACSLEVVHKLIYLFTKSMQDSGWYYLLLLKITCAYSKTHNSHTWLRHTRLFRTRCQYYAGNSRDITRGNILCWCSQ